jgi:uncharacterized protein YukE
MIAGRSYLAGAGASNTAVLAFGGSISPVNTACTETYNGTAWSAGGAMIAGRYLLAGAGTTTSALAFGGRDVNCITVACTEAYNGSSWSAGSALSVVRYQLAGSGASNTAVLAFGGNNGSILSCTEAYNGTSWSAGSALINARKSLAGAGTNTAALAFGGYNPPTTVACTEAYNSSTTLTKSFDYSSTTGITTVSQLIETSAQRYKQNVQQLTSQLSKINQLKPVEFDWKSNQKHDIGFIAEEVQEVYPELVNINEQGEVEGLSYSKMISALVKGMQEQQEQIKNLTQEINNLKNK